MLFYQGNSRTTRFLLLLICAVVLLQSGHGRLMGASSLLFGSGRRYHQDLAIHANVTKASQQLLLERRRQHGKTGQEPELSREEWGDGSDGAEEPASTEKKKVVAISTTTTTTPKPFKVGDEVGSWVYPNEDENGARMAVPGVDWLTDESESVVFLEIRKSKELDLEHLRIFTNGEVVLVLVTSAGESEEKEESKAEIKYKMVLDALKKDANYDDAKLEKKLREWYEAETDEEVKALVGSALDGMERAAETEDKKRTVTVKLELLRTAVAAIAKTTTLRDPPPELAGKLNVSSSSAKTAGHHLGLLTKEAGVRGRSLKVIKESFSVSLAFPIEPQRVFALQKDEEQIFICLPFDHPGPNQGPPVANYQSPLVPVPVFDLTGKQLKGPGTVNFVGVPPNSEDRRLRIPPASSLPDSVVVN